MSWNSVLVVCGLWAVVVFVCHKIRTQSIKVLAEDLKASDFIEESTAWYLKYLILKPVLRVKNSRYSVWYYKTVDRRGVVRESATIYRFMYAPLHVFYIGGKPSRVKGGLVKLEILEDEELSEVNLKKILKELRFKHQKFLSYGQAFSLN